MRQKEGLISDLAQMANGVASTLGCIREDVDVFRKTRQDRAQAAGGSVTQEDFEAVLTRIDALAARIAALESAHESAHESAPAIKKPSTKSK